MKRAIVIQGAPGVGKSTLAVKLSNDLGWRVLMKDAFKEALYDTAGAPHDRDESQLYGRIAIKAMYAALFECIKSNIPVIIEAPLNPAYAREELSHIAPLNDLLQLHVYCDARLQEQRFRQRIETKARHDSHQDDSVNGIETQARCQPIDGIDTISVDTTVFTDEEYELLLAVIHKKINGGGNEATN